MYIPSDPKVWTEIGRDPLLRKPRFWLPALGAALIAFGMPDNIFEKLPFLAVIVNIISDAIPSVDIWTQRSSFPNITQLLFAYCWMIMPLYAYVVATHKPYEQAFLSKWLGRKQWIRNLKPILLILIWISFFLLFYYIALPVDTACSRMCIHESKLLQGFYGLFFSIGGGSICGAVFWWLKNFKFIHLTKFHKSGGVQ